MNNDLNYDGRRLVKLEFEEMLRSDDMMLCVHYTLNNSITKYGVDFTKPMQFNEFLKLIGTHLTGFECKSLLSQADWYILTDDSDYIINKFYKKKGVCKIMRTDVIVKRTTNLKDPNLNGVKYEQESLRRAIDEFCCSDNSNKLYFDSVSDTAYEKVSIGEVINISDENIKIVIEGEYVDKFKSIKDPVAIFSYDGYLENGIHFINSIRCIEIVENKDV